MLACVRVCVCVCVHVLEVQISNAQLSHQQHGEITECFSLDFSVSSIFSSMNMHYFGNLKLKMLKNAPAHLPPDRWEIAQVPRETIPLKF